MVISELYGKNVESTSGRKGYVISVNGSSGKVECLVCADGEENEFFVDFRDIVSIGAKIVYEDRSAEMKKAKPIKIGLAAYDDGGKFLGNVEDYSLSGEKIVVAKIGKKSYPAENLILGDAVIVKKTKQLNKNVVKDGKILFKKGAQVTSALLEKATQNGEYVQTNLKTL